MGPETKVSGPIFACSSLSRLRRQLPLGGSLFVGTGNLAGLPKASLREKDFPRPEDAGL